MTEALENPHPYNTINFSERSLTSMEGPSGRDSSTYSSATPVERSMDIKPSTAGYKGWGSTLNGSCAPSTPSRRVEAILPNWVGLLVGSRWIIGTRVDPSGWLRLARILLWCSIGGVCFRNQHQKPDFLLYIGLMIATPYRQSQQDLRLFTELMRPQTSTCSETAWRCCLAQGKRFLACVHHTYMLGPAGITPQNPIRHSSCLQANHPLQMLIDPAAGVHDDDDDDADDCGCPLPLRWHMHAKERVWKQLLSTWCGSHTPNLLSTLTQ
eukprot:345367-Amphidinium_carterae.2